MAETVTIEGQTYLKRNPLGVLGLSVVTIGIYGLYWYYKVNDEIRRFERDDSISPARSILALLPGALLIVPPIIAVYNTAQHILKMEERAGIQQQISPALTVVLLIAVSIAIGIYVQEHLNRIWDRASAGQGLGGAAPEPPPSVPA